MVWEPAYFGKFFIFILFNKDVSYLASTVKTHPSKCIQWHCTVRSAHAKYVLSLLLVVSLLLPIIYLLTPCFDPNPLEKFGKDNFMFLQHLGILWR